MRKTNPLRMSLCLLLTLLLVMTASFSTLAPVYAAKKAKISKTKATLYVKETLKLKVTGAVKKVTWSSSNKNVAKVSSKGVVTAVKKGTAKITAKTGKQKLTCKVTVKNPTISDSEIAVELTKSKKLKVSHAVGKVKWSSSDPSVASVSSTGVVTGLRAGEAEIAAIASGVKLTCKVDVYTSIGTYYCVWNVNADLSPVGAGKSQLTPEQAAEVRTAINGIVDRAYIVSSIVQLDRTLAPSLVPKGLKEPDGSEFYQNAGPEGHGYYPLTADIEYAVQTLKKYYSYDEANGSITFTDFPVIKYIYNTPGLVHAGIGEHLKSQLAPLGITVTLEGIEWDDYDAALQAGDYTISKSGWLIDIYDAVNILEVFRTDGENNDAKLGTGNNADVIYEVDLSGIGGGKYAKFSGNWRGTYDLMLSYIYDEPDLVLRSQLLHKAEDLLMSTGCICPLYYYTE